MPVHRSGRRGCFQWGHHGAVYCGPGARQRAERQGRAARAHGYRGREAASDDVPPIVVEANDRYPRAGPVVDGLVVRDRVPNTDSIEGYFGEHWTLRHVRVVPMADFGSAGYASADDTARSQRLASQIRESGEINPLIVGYEATGPFIIEGGHRHAALHYLGKQAFPALVVVSLDGGPETSALALTESYEPDLSYLLGPRGAVRAIGPEDGPEPPAHGIARYRSPHGSTRYVYYVDGAPVSALQVTSRDRRHARVANVWTAPHARRRGYATLLLQRARRDFKTVEHSDDLSPDARAWIERVGEAGLREARGSWAVVWLQGGEWVPYQRDLSRARASRLARDLQYTLSPRWYGRNIPAKAVPDSAHLGVREDVDAQDAIDYVRRQPEPPGWSGDVAISIRFDPKAVSYTYRGRREDLPLRSIPVDRLVATQPTVDRDALIQLLSGGLDQAPPILVLQVGDWFWVQDGHHRADAALLLGRETIEAYLRPPPAPWDVAERRRGPRSDHLLLRAPPAEIDWEGYLGRGEARYVDRVVRPQMPDVVARAAAAGMPPGVEYVGAGMTGVVFCAGDVAFKVARDTREVDRMMLEEEAEWLAAASAVPEVAPHVARFHRFDPDNVVIERDCPHPDPDQSLWRWESKLYELHKSIERAMLPNGWTAPEFKPDSYVLTPRGPVLVDASLPMRVGAALAQYVEDVVAGARPLWTRNPHDLTFYVRSEIGKTLTQAEADHLQAILVERWPEARW